MLEIERLDAGYGDVAVLHGIDLTVEAGAVTALLGSNGAGKTTLMRTVAGLIAPRAGRLRFAGQPIERLPASRRVEMGLVLVPEGRMLFPDSSVEENLLLGAFTPAARPKARARLEEIYALFPRLAERRRQRAGSLSGGEQQMAALGRGLMAGPKILLLDEPSLGLAPKMAQLVFETIAAIRAQGIGILLAEQDAHAALAVADSALVLENGRPILAGPAAQLRANKQVRESYLGL